MQPNQPTGSENTPQPTEKTPAQAPELGAKEVEKKSIAAAEQTPSQPSGTPASAPVLPVALSNQPNPAQTSAQTPTAQLPADIDEDLIEKPWVEKAEQIIKEDREDPHKLGDDENDLNKDYLKTRFNYDVDDAQ